MGKRIRFLQDTCSVYVATKPTIYKRIKLLLSFGLDIIKTIKIMIKKPHLSDLPDGSILLQDECPNGLIAYNKYMGRWYHKHGNFADPIDDAAQLHNDVFLYMGLYIKPKRVIVK